MKNQILATGRNILGPNREYESRIERRQSSLKMLLVPILSVMVGSMTTALFFWADAPILPPIGFMMFLAWRLMRPGMWSAWVGLPFGLFDDLFSGQPFGSAGLMWSLTMLAIEIVDSRVIWRDHVQDWFLAAIAIISVITGGVGISALVYQAPAMQVVYPQIFLSILIYPLLVRLCARLDNWRLAT